MKIKDTYKMKFLRWLERRFWFWVRLNRMIIRFLSRIYYDELYKNNPDLPREMWERF